MVLLYDNRQRYDMDSTGLVSSELSLHTARIMDPDSSCPDPTSARSGSLLSFYPCLHPNLLSLLSTLSIQPLLPDSDPVVGVLHPPSASSLYFHHLSPRPTSTIYFHHLSPPSICTIYLHHLPPPERPSIIGILCFLLAPPHSILYTLPMS